MDKSERWDRHLKKEFAEGRKRPTLWAFFHLRNPRMSFSYRGHRVRFYDDDSGQQYYSYLFGEARSFGAYNLCCAEEAKTIIDDRLDFVCVVDTPKEYPNGEVRWHYGNDGKRHLAVFYDDFVRELDGSVKDIPALQKEAYDEIAMINSLMEDYSDHDGRC